MQSVKTKTILVTGGSGFVGLLLLEQLIEKTCPDTIIVALHNRDLNASKDRFNKKVVWKRVDITTDDLSDVVKDAYAVFHLAAYSTIEESAINYSRMELVNVYGTKRLVDACKEFGPKHLIYVSSIAACEVSKSSLIDEETGHPISAYGKTKKASEQIILEKSGDGLEVTILRPTALFGENHLGSVFELVNAIDLGRFLLFGRGDNNTNFYYARDFIDVLVAIPCNPIAYGQIFIAADRPCSLYNFVSIISSELGRRKVRKIPLVLGHFIALICDVASNICGLAFPLSRRRFRAMTRDVIYSNQKLVSMLGISPRYGVSTGLKRAINFYRSERLIGLD